MKGLKKVIYLLTLVSVVLFASSCSSSDEDEPVKSSEKKILEFSVFSGDEKVVIDEINKTITVLVPSYLGDLFLTATIKVSEKATVTPNGYDKIDYSNPVKFIVTAEDGSKQEYTATIRRMNSEYNITKFTINGKDAIVNDPFNKDKIILMLPYGTDLTRLTPNIQISEGATIQPAGNVATDFTNPVTYVVTDESGKWNRTYVTEIQALPFDFKITSVTPTKVSPKQFIDIYGVFNPKNEKMGVTLSNETNRRECSIVEYAPDKIRVRVSELLPGGIYDLNVHYYRNENKVTYSEKIEIALKAPHISGLTSWSVTNQDVLFIHGYNFKSTTGQKARIFCIPNSDSEPRIDLYGDVVTFGGQDIIYVNDLTKLKPQHYRCVVYIDGVASYNTEYLYIKEQSVARPVITAINNTNPQVDETVTLTVTGGGISINSNRIDLYANIIEGSDIYYPIHIIGSDKITFNSQQGASPTLSFKMPKVGNVTRFKVKVVDEYGISSQFYSGEIVLK